MKKEEYGKLTFSKTAKRVLVSTLALSMAVSGTTWASLANKANNAGSEIKEDKTYYMGDVNFDGEVDLTDANLVLKGSLKIDPLTGDAIKIGDMDKNGEITLEDANSVLKTALKITEKVLYASTPSSTEPVNSGDPVESGDPVTTPTPTTVVTTSPTTPPTATPDLYPVPTALPPVTADAANVVSGTAAVPYDSHNSEYSESTKQIKFASPEAFGVEFNNPFKGHEELNIPVASATSLEAEEGKQNCWTLTGASFVKRELSSEDFQKLDPRIYNQEDTETVTYTKPSWNGVSFSFWEKATSEFYNSDPLIVMSNGRLSLMVRKNGSVRFEDANDNTNFLDIGTTNFVHGNYGEWNYYTVTIANDWVQVYVNGQENLYTNLTLSRKSIQTFNDGFLTRYNPATNATQELIDSDPRRYYTKVGAWYYNDDEKTWMAHDNFTVFGNGRFRGANSEGKLISDLLTDEETQLWIGGADTTAGFNTDPKLPKDSRILDVTYYMSELTPEQVSANYSVAVKPDATTENATDFKKITPTDAPTEDVGPKATTDPNGGDVVSISKVGNWADYDADKNEITFKEPTGDSLDTISGVKMVNPFANKAAELTETMADALSGQSIFPWKDANGNTYMTEGDLKYKGGHDPYAAEVWRGNFYDVYYGDVDKYGNSPLYDAAKRPGLKANYLSATAADIKTQDELETLFPDKKTTYQVPKWSSGASVSFWAKPVQIDDSPLLTFFLNTKIALSMTVRGDICYYSMNDVDWTKGVASNGEPKNTFATLGDASMVKANEWNFYTVTIANDWIQVYVNGKEMVYDYVNLNRTEIKGINGGYLTRYNTIGIWNNDMIAKNGDPSGKTADGRERNYLTKSGLYFDFTKASNENGSVLSDKGPNSGCDGASRRSSSSYVNPFKADSATADTGGELLMNLFSLNKVQMFIGGKSTAIDEGDYTFSSIKVPETTDPTLVNFVPADKDGDGVEDYGAYKKIYKTAHTLDAGTEVSVVKSYMKELKDSEVEKCYNDAVSDIASPGALVTK